LSKGQEHLWNGMGRKESLLPPKPYRPPRITPGGEGKKVKEARPSDRGKVHFIFVGGVLVTKRATPSTTSPDQDSGAIQGGPEGRHSPSKQETLLHPHSPKIDRVVTRRVTLAGPLPSDQKTRPGADEVGITWQPKGRRGGLVSGLQVPGVGVIQYTSERKGERVAWLEIPRCGRQQLTF